MALTYTYPDAYLVPFCTEAVEDRAEDEIALFEGQLPSDQEFSDEWLERLTVTQAYIFACIDNQAEPEDLFTAKLKTYRQQMQLYLPQATAAAAAEAGTVGGLALFSIPLERA